MLQRTHPKAELSRSVMTLPKINGHGRVKHLPNIESSFSVSTKSKRKCILPDLKLQSSSPLGGLGKRSHSNLPCGLLNTSEDLSRDNPYSLEGYKGLQRQASCKQVGPDASSANSESWEGAWRLRQKRLARGLAK